MGNQISATPASIVAPAEPQQHQTIEPIVETENEECQVIGYDDLPQALKKAPGIKQNGSYLKSSYQDKDIYLTPLSKSNIGSQYYADSLVDLKLSPSIVLKTFDIQKMLSVTSLDDLTNRYYMGMKDFLTCDPAEFNPSIFDPQVLSYLESNAKTYLTTAEQELIQTSQECTNAYKNLRRLAEWDKLSQEQRDRFKNTADALARNLRIRPIEYVTTTPLIPTETQPTSTETVSTPITQPTAAVVTTPKYTWGVIFYAIGKWWFCPLLWPGLIFFGGAKVLSWFGCCNW